MILWCTICSMLPKLISSAPRVVRNFRSRRRENRSGRRNVSFLSFINNEAMKGSLLLHKGGSGVLPQKILWKYAFFWWSFCYTVVNISSILHVYFVMTNFSLILQKVDGASDLSSWRYCRAPLLLDNPVQLPAPWLFLHPAPGSLVVLDPILPAP